MNKLILAAAIAAATTNVGLSQTTMKPKPTLIEINGVIGYQDTPMEPNGQWHIHDPARPQPPVVTTGNFSQMAAPPSDATVLFDGKDFSEWRDKKTGGPAQWPVADGVGISAKGDIVTSKQFGDVQLHLEFKEPPATDERGQGRGNSGVFFMDRYEVQVLDCYQNKTYPDGTTGAIYGQHPPLANACRPPGEWETYDIIFTTPQYDAAGQLTAPAYVTVILNGVVVQNHQTIRGAPTHRTVGQSTSHDLTGPLALQYHKNSVSFRNIWVRPVPLVNEP